MTSYKKKKEKKKKNKIIKQRKEIIKWTSGLSRRSGVYVFTRDSGVRYAGVNTVCPRIDVKCILLSRATAVSRASGGVVACESSKTILGASSSLSHSPVSSVHDHNARWNFPLLKLNSCAPLMRKISATRAPFLVSLSLPTFSSFFSSSSFFFSYERKEIRRCRSVITYARSVNTF